MMKKLEESQDKLAALQLEQARLLQMQKNAESQLAQMTLLKKTLERSQNMGNNINSNSNVNLALAYRLINGNQTNSNNTQIIPNGRDSRSQSSLNYEINNDDLADDYNEGVNMESDETEDDIYDLLRISKLRNLQKKKHKMNGMLRDIENQQAVREKKAELIERLLISSGLQPNSPQRRYEADGSEEDQMRVNQLISSVSHPNNSNVSNLLDNVDGSSPLASKIKQLQEAETRLKQVEALMKSIEDIENNIKIEENEKHLLEERKSLNETPRNNSTVRQPPRQSRNHTVVTHVQNARQQNQDKNVSNRNYQSLTDALSHNSHLQENQRLNCLPNRNNNTTTTSQNHINTNEMSNSYNDFFLQTMRSNFESMISLFENQISNVNYMNNDQILQMILMQNCQIMLQQQMILISLQNHQQTPFSHFDSNSLLSNQHNQLNSRPLEREQITLNNQVVPGVRANNYWDNFKSHTRQNKLSTSSNNVLTINKSNENLISNHHNHLLQGLNSLNASLLESTTNQEVASTSNRNQAKSANSSHYIQENVEKQQNLPINDILGLKHFGSQLDSNHIASLYSMLEKLLENDENCDSKLPMRKKSLNLVASKNSEEEEDDDDDDNVVENEEGAVGGLSTSNYSHEDDVNENRCPLIPQQTSSRTHIPVTMPLHISPSSGAIRKKPRNQEILELNSRTDLNETIISNTSENIRPLMPAEGRPSENILTNKSNNSPQTNQVLLIRPPITGAPGYSDNDDNSSLSTDDDLVEADQTAVADTINAEPEAILNNNISNLNIQDNQRIKEELNIPVENDEDDEEERLLGVRSNESAIRLSGDGEQGL